MLSTDIAIRDIALDYEDFRYRSPIKFGGVALDRVTILNVNMVVEDRRGKKSKGFGSMPLGNVWAWPTRAMTYDQTLEAMREFAEISRQVYLGTQELRPPYRYYAHPGAELVGSRSRTEASRYHARAGQARCGQPIRCRPPRCLRQVTRAELLSHLWFGFPGARSWPLPEQGVYRRTTRTSYVSG